MESDLDSELSFAFHLAKCLLACCFAQNIILAVHQLYLQKFLWKVFLPSLKFFTNRAISVVVHMYSVCSFGVFNLLWHLLYCAYMCVEQLV